MGCLGADFTWNRGRSLPWGGQGSDLHLPAWGESSGPAQVGSRKPRSLNSRAGLRSQTQRLRGRGAVCRWAQVPLPKQPPPSGTHLSFLPPNQREEGCRVPSPPPRPPPSRELEEPRGRRRVSLTCGPQQARPLSQSTNSD